MRISIIIPAYNEEKRIARSLTTYNDFFLKKKSEESIEFELLVVINGTTDATEEIVRNMQKNMSNIRMINIKEGGKGRAIKEGFKDALKRDNDLIGFVDADMATSPQAYYELIANINNYDGVIASRYMTGAMVSPPRPFIKRWGSKIFFETLVKLFFGIHYYDTQCGAKLFKRKVVETIVPYLTVTGWAFDVEILYLCKRFKFSIKEIPTIWYDQDGSKLNTLGAGSKMLSALWKLRWHYWHMKI